MCIRDSTHTHSHTHTHMHTHTHTHTHTPTQMRAKNSYTLFSSWSSAVVLPLDNHCLVQPPPSNSNTSTQDGHSSSVLSVFFEADDGSRVKLLDIGCNDNPGSSEQSFHDRLGGIESRYSTHTLIP